MAITGSADRQMQRPGFTLLELMLTLAVVVAISAIAIPNLFDILADRQLVRSGNGVRIAMVQARLEAMRTGRTQMMRVELGGQRFKVEPLSSNNDVTEAADMLGQGTAVMTGGVGMTPIANGDGVDDGSAAGQASEEADASMDREMLLGKTVFGQPQVQATARSATLQQEAAQLGQVASPGDGSGWSQPILFYADGTTSNAVVPVMLAERAKVLIKIRGLTGETDVTEVMGL